MILPQVAMRFTKAQNPDIFDSIVANGKERLFANGVTPELKAKFFEYLEEVLQLQETALMERFRIIAEQKPGAGPFMYENGTIVDGDKCSETVFNAVKHNTMAFGYIGCAEMCQILFGENHVHNAEAYDFALKVVTRIHDYAAEATKRRHLNFSCYATPAEGLCHTALKALQRQYGKIEGIFDRDYLTNSHHVPVWEQVSIMEKLRLEAPFTKLATGGCITYIEVDSTFISNLDAVEKIIDYAFQVLNIPYLAFNFPIDTCLKCGFTGEFNDGMCPECGSNDIESLRRVTGYLNKDYRKFNKGKRSEVLDRVRHVDYTDVANEISTEE